MPIDMEKNIVVFKHKTLGEWQLAVHDQQVLSNISPVEVFISLFVPIPHFLKADVVEIMKEVAATLVYEKFVANKSLIREIACEKKKAIRPEIWIFLQKE